MSKYWAKTNNSFKIQWPLLSVFFKYCSFIFQRKTNKRNLRTIHILTCLHYNTCIFPNQFNEENRIQAIFLVGNVNIAGQTHSRPPHATVWHSYVFCARSSTIEGAKCPSCWQAKNQTFSAESRTPIFPFLRQLFPTWTTSSDLMLTMVRGVSSLRPIGGCANREKKVRTVAWEFQERMVRQNGVCYGST